MPGPTKPGRYRDAVYGVSRDPGEKPIPDAEAMISGGLRRNIALALALLWARAGWSVTVTRTLGVNRIETIATGKAGAKRLSYLH